MARGGGRRERDGDPGAAARPEDFGLGRLFWAIPEAVVVADAATGRITLWNPAAQALLGYPAAEALGRDVAVLVPDRLGEAHRAGLARYRDTGRGRLVDSGAPVELVAVRRDGAEIPVELTLTALDAPGGRYVLAFIRDLTERRRAEEAVRAGAEAFETLFEAAAEGVAIHEGGRHVAVNHALAAMLGYEPDELVGREVWEVVAPESRALVRAHALDGYPHPYEAVGLRRDGATFPCEILGKPIRYRGRPARLVTVRDITARRRAEEARARVIHEQAARHAAEAHGRLMALVAEVGLTLMEGGALRPVLQRCAAALVARLDAAFARIWTLDAGAQLLELQASAGLYTHLDGPHAHIPVGQFKIGRIAAERAPHLTNDVQRDPLVSDPAWARREGMVAFAGYPLLVEGRLLGVLALFARRPLAPETLAALEPAARAIAQDLARRQAEVERARLLDAERAARAEAEAALRARDTFLAIAAHELKTPLTTLKGAAQLLRRREERGALAPERLTGGLHTIERSADRLAALVNDLLDVSRLRAGHLALTLGPVDLPALVGEAVARAREQHGDTHRFALDGPAALAPVAADAGRLEQVVTNLLDNAVKYSPAGGEVAVAVRAAGGGALVSVRDAGIGLPPGSEAAIFEPFGRAPNAERGRVPGMGLGLYICRTIVERHGGWIRAASGGEGRGATFSVWLPLAAPPAPAAPA